jgi:hypothetical protein
MIEDGTSMTSREAGPIGRNDEKGAATWDNEVMMDIEAHRREFH